MKAAELRIGNWVLFPHLYGEVGNQKVEKYAIIDEIHTAMDEGICFKHARTQGMSIRAIKPIPITAEWLIKFGFTEMQIRKGYFIKPLTIDNRMTLTSEDFIFHLKSGYVYVDFGDIVTQIGIPIIYVHEFQNIYFALTGEEIII